MRALPSGLLGALLLVGAAVADDAPTAPDVRYAGPDEVATRLRALAGKEARVASYGKSASGRDLLVLRLGRADLPQVLVTGGVGDRDAAATAAALDFAARVLAPPLAGKPSPLERVGFMVVPAPNPDALAGFLAGGRFARGGGDVDRDLDGKAGEDGPDDLDGDGEVLWMRRRIPAGPMGPDDAAPAADGKLLGDPRLVKDLGVDVRRAVSWDRVVREGKDDDGDGDVDEDPPGQDLTRNFMGFWDEAGAWPGEGPFPGSAPEAAALMELSWTTSNLVAWYEFASEGPRIERPSERGKDADADDALYGRLVPAWKAACGLETRKASDRPGASENRGASLDWAARHLGVAAARVPVWRVEKDPRNGRDRGDPDELDWLLWNDRVLGGKGFVPWHEAKHPQWGTVEVGGWRRFTRWEPPADLLAPAVRAVSLVPAVHADFAPRLAVGVEVERLSDGLWKAKARVSNPGGGPTETELAVRGRRSMGVRVGFVVAKGAEVVAGPRLADAGVLAAGGISNPIEWVVRGGPGELGVVTARHRVAGSASARAATP